MFQYLIIQSVEQQHVSVPHHSVSGGTNNMFQYLIIQSVVEQQHVSVPHHSVSGTATCFSTLSFSQWNNNMFQYLIISQWNNNMFQYLIIQSVEQQHVSVPHHSVSGTTTCFSTSSFSQWNNNMFQYLIIHSVEQQYVSVLIIQSVEHNMFQSLIIHQWNNNMFQYLIIQSVVEQQHVSVPHHSVSGTRTCFSPSFSQWNNNMFQYSSFSQWWNNNMFQYLIIQSVEQQHVSVPHHSVSGTTTCFSTSSFSEVELEGASWVLRLDGAADGEGGASEHLEPLLLGPGDPVHGGGHRDVGLKQQELQIVDVSNADGEHLDAQSHETIGGILNVVLRLPGLEVIHVENFGGVVPGHDLQLCLVGSFNSDTEDADPVFPQSHGRRYQTVAICGIPVRDHHEDLRHVEVRPAAIVFVEEW
ncbi:hypothetical protein F7725_017760 [Dissostichus mawsoni]|uniref:Uncharacterized protein n=1 Tax=Dissostichus mawsoni TaxID=36200 RepID=A0A7J5XQC5_DISMA|nr:hypothetical protein F7725_017760 [Dissostichus mawsoni]